MNIPNRCKSTPKYLGMMFVYTIILAVIFSMYAGLGTAGKMIAVGFALGCVIGVMRESRMWLKWKRAQKEV